MEHPDEYIDELIAKSLTGEIEDYEINILNNWKTTGGLNEKYYRDLKKIYDTTGEIFRQSPPDIESAWNRFHEKLSGQDKKQPVLKKIRFSFYSRAAAILVLAAAGSFLYYLTAREKQLTLASSSVPVSDTLPDGTFVSLGPASTLACAPDFNLKNRELNFSGEAYFRVQHNAALPFLIKTSGIFIKDIGTAFNIKAQDADSVIRVSMEEGEVVFYADQNPGISLVKGETGIYNKRSHAFRKKAKDVTPISAGEALKFEDAALRSVVDTLNKTFHVHIELSCAKLEDLRLTASFRGEPVNAILETIAETLNLSIARNQETILLDSQSCKN